MGINYKYDIDTAGGGWYLYELEIMPCYIAPLKCHADGKEGRHAWGIYDEHGRMSDFRFNAWKWSPTFHGFADGYIIDETHDKYWGGHVGEEKYRIPDNHRWPCFCLDAQLVAGLSMMLEYVQHASIGCHRDRDDGNGLYLGNNDYLADIGFRFHLPDLSSAIDFMKRNDIPREHYKDVACRLVSARKVKKELGIEYGNLGWGYRRPVKYDERENTPSPVGEMLDKYAAAIEKMQSKGNYELTCDDLIGTIDETDGIT